MSLLSLPYRIALTDPVSNRHLNRRAEAVTLAVDGQTLEGIAQTGLNTITCSGFGGLAALALGVTQGSALKGKASISPSLDNSTLAALPQGPLTVMNEGNKFTITLADQTVTINGLDLKPFAIMTGLHSKSSTYDAEAETHKYSRLLYPSILLCSPDLPCFGGYLAFLGHDRPTNRRGEDKEVAHDLTVSICSLRLPGHHPGDCEQRIRRPLPNRSQCTFHIYLHQSLTNHFQIFGLISLLFVLPAAILSFMRLRTTIPIPPPSAFLFKNQLSILKGPQKIHVIASMLVQQALTFGMISWAQGFADLRDISLCIVDAILTAPLLVGILNAVLFTQIGSTGLLLARFILERRIALNGGNTSYNEKPTKRSNTMLTFGFDTPHPPNPTPPPLAERRTADLLGKEDAGIGRPFAPRKLGSRDLDVQNDNPFADSGEQQRGSGDERGALFPPFRPSQSASDTRPSSELLGERPVNYAPPETEKNMESGAPGPMHKRFDSFSRPLGTAR